MYNSNWWTHVENAFPGDSSGQMTIRVRTVCSGLMDDTESIDLPAPTYADKNDDLYAKEHEAAWDRALDRLEHKLKSRGVTLGSSDDNDVYSMTNYMPSDGSSARRPGWSACIQRASILAGISSRVPTFMVRQTHHERERGAGVNNAAIGVSATMNF